MKGRVWEQVMIAAVVVVHVRDDHVAHLPGFNADHGQTLAWAAQHLAAALLTHDAIKTGVHNVALVRPDDCPDEIVKWHQLVMRIATEKILGSTTFMMVGITHSIDLIWRESGHRCSPVGQSVGGFTCAPAHCSTSCARVVKSDSGPVWPLASNQS